MAQKNPLKWTTEYGSVAASFHDFATTEGTQWRTVNDLTNRVFYFESSTSPNVIWVRLDRLAFAVGSPVMKLDLVGDRELVGEVSGQFKKTKSFMFAGPPG